ncbi:MAG: hypothetical protein GEV10_26030 [Streptosporangiales bacterium]|nr:hypothetical protein [Streptosporangiales bacterium]
MLPQFRGVVVSGKTRDSVVESLSAACEKATKGKKFRQFQTKVYADEDSFQSADDFQKFLDDQTRTIEQQLKSYGITR